MQRRRYCNWCRRDALPFAAMVSMESIYVGLNTLFKAATLKGMSFHVFMVYAYAIAALLLLPPALFSSRSRDDHRQVGFSVVCRICLLGLVGGVSQIMGYTGIVYSSPTLSSAMSNLTPAFTFLLAIAFRMERLELRNSRSQAKVMGTVVSIAGALVVTLYRGQAIIPNGSSISLHQPLHRSQSSWIIGSLFLTTQYTLVTFCIIVGLVTEPRWNAWRIRLDVTLASILCSGVFGSLLNNVVHAWVLHLKGPVYTVMFKPLSIAIAVAMGVIFLGDTLYLGSVVGATIISIGFYTVMWGKANEH
ncbi:WAT1-related protein At3g28050-like isoform X5 [Diospyros lotus]|uniref:WAT1-related protein At3g28050-like isoform X5 n=1 Tax=Diospyros lotus TaxID=55363 RepID=UPI002259144D|nr:WAT1-related protein At3g28050-like isoform X5 [Diospyros lotus]